jgi:hypothetical protein
MRRMVVAALIGIAVVTSACGGEDAERVAASPEPSATETDRTAPEGGTSMAASCVETYSLDALKNRDYALDGTIKSIQPGAADGPDTAVFTVAKWFKGGEGATAERKGTFSSMTSAGGSERKVGDRLLVAGDDDFVWDCGFTQPYDAQVAADWDSAFSE